MHHIYKLQRMDLPILTQQLLPKDVIISANSALHGENNYILDIIRGIKVFFFSSKI